MSKTVVGLFSTIAQAEQVKQALVADGYESHNIKVVANDSSEATSSTTTTASDRESIDGGEGIGEKISKFFRSLTGGDETVHNHYATGVNQGGALLAVSVDDNETDEVAAALRQYGARDIEGGYEKTEGTKAPAYDKNSASMTGDTAIPVIEEQLVVGKREVDRGGVRVYSHVSERPVEADVTLREERINVERRPVDRPATAADFQAGNGSMFELNATSEEAVVAKTSRVVEEVLVGKQSSERTEAVRDTVRKTEVEVENIDSTARKNLDGMTGKTFDSMPTKNIDSTTAMDIDETDKDRF